MKTSPFFCKLSIPQKTFTRFNGLVLLPVSGLGINSSALVLRGKSRDNPNIPSLRCGGIVPMFGLTNDL